MRNFFRFLLYRPIMWAAGKFSSKPNRPRIFEALSALRQDILEHPGKKGVTIPFEWHAGKFIIFSDQHKGRRNGADDFKLAEPNYLAALDYYDKKDFWLINLGDSEELWENNIWQVRKKNKANFEAEKKFIDRNKYVKIYGNHDLYWNNGVFAFLHLKNMFGTKIPVYEGVILPVSIGNKEIHIFCTHGHQGDGQSDGNWFSKFFVAHVWGPLQAFLRINPNTPAYDGEKKTLHNSLMYEWSSEQQNTLLITGHTHQPVFESLTHLERLYKQLQFAQRDHNKNLEQEALTEIKKRETEFTAVALDYMTMKPSYFNTGCCCFSDGDITGIEIADGSIRLIKWTLQDNIPVRQVLEEKQLEELAGVL